jgi:hypothetical protein
VGNGLSSTFPAGREEETDPIQASFSASYEKIGNSIVCLDEDSIMILRQAKELIPSGLDGVV